jgi:hypothetical protein
MHGAVWHRPRAEIAREVILRRTPSHVVNLAAFIRWLVAAAVIVVSYVCAEPPAGSVICAAARRCQRAPRAHGNESQNRGIVTRL